MQTQPEEIASSVAIASLRALLVQVQSYGILTYDLQKSIARSKFGGEFCEILEEIANKYISLAERIESARMNIYIKHPDHKEMQLVSTI